MTWLIILTQMQNLKDYKMAETSNWYNIGYRAKAGDLGINKPTHKEAWEQVQDMLMQKQK